MAEAAAWALVLGVLGAIVGSFAATLVLRWPEGRSVMRGRSVCDGCGRTLAPVELVPIASALVLRGRSRCCGSAIDPLHGRVELCAALVGASAGWMAPGVTGAAGALFGWMLLTLAALDARAFWLPDRIVAPLAVAGAGFGAAGIGPPPADRIAGGAAGFALLWLVALGYRHWRGREGLGGGDPKMLGAIGLWLGWRPLPAILLSAGLAGLGIVLFRLLTGRAVTATDALPLGTLMAIAAYPTWLMLVGSWP